MSALVVALTQLFSDVKLKKSQTNLTDDSEKNGGGGGTRYDPQVGFLKIQNVHDIQQGNTKYAYDLRRKQPCPSPLIIVKVITVK